MTQNECGIAGSLGVPFVLLLTNARGFNSSSVVEMKNVRGLNGGGNGNTGRSPMTDDRDDYGIIRAELLRLAAMEHAWKQWIKDGVRVEFLSPEPTK